MRNGSMDCNACRALLLEYLKDELTPEVARRIRGHLEACRGCESCAEFERNYLALLSTTLEHRGCPEDVRVKILAVLSFEATQQ